MGNEHVSWHSFLHHFAYTMVLGGLTMQLSGETKMELVKLKNLAFRGSYPPTSLASCPIEYLPKTQQLPLVAGEATEQKGKQVTSSLPTLIN